MPGCIIGRIARCTSIRQRFDFDFFWLLVTIFMTILAERVVCARDESGDEDDGLLLCRTTVVHSPCAVLLWSDPVYNCARSTVHVVCGGFYWELGSAWNLLVLDEKGFLMGRDLIDP